MAASDGGGGGGRSTLGATSALDIGALSGLGRDVAPGFSVEAEGIWSGAGCAWAGRAGT